MNEFPVLAHDPTPSARSSYPENQEDGQLPDSLIRGIKSGRPRPILIPVYRPEIGETEISYVTKAVTSGWVSSKGKYIGEFERTFAKFCGRKHAVATSNGTAALHLAMLALEVGPRDEVLVPDMTFISTANAAKYVGATPKFLDSNEDNWCLDVSKLEKAITPATKAIIPVHLYGHPVDMDPLLEVAEKHDIRVVEDAAEAHGARYKKRMVGSFGDVSCFSFYGNKIVTTGEGGMCLTDDPGLAEKIRVFRDHGTTGNPPYVHDVIGYNYRMTNLQAALGVAQMRRIHGFISRKKKIARAYADRLKGVPQVSIQEEASWAESVWWMFSIVLKRPHIRDRTIARLASLGVETRPFFKPIHLQKPYRTRSAQRFPVAERLGASGINLPSYPSLGERSIDSITTKLVTVLEK